MKTVKTLALLATMGLSFGAKDGLAAALKKTSSSGGGSVSSSKSGNRDWLVSLPIMAESPQLRLHVEYNLSNSVGVALEGALIGKTEDLSRDEVKETGNSRVVGGAQASLLMARYSDPARMSGFFWSLGGGYRKWTAEWKKQPGKDDEERMALVDSDGYLHHRLDGKGVTGHARMGYRYVGSDWPLSIGGHVGLRHMNSTISDIKVSDEETKKLNLQYSKIDEVERKSLKHQMMTSPDISVEVGFAF